MEELELKIFDVLTESISVSQFETWIYSSEELLNEIDSNPFYFNIVSINYKNQAWSQKLNNLTKEYFSYDFLEVLKIKKSCLNILSTETFKETHKILNYFTQGFDYDTEYSVLWKFYALKDYFDLVEEGVFKIGTLELEARFYAEQTLYILRNKETINDAVFALKADLSPFIKPKISLIKILSRKISNLIKLTLKIKNY